jgi:hypothetical protein
MNVIGKASNIIGKTGVKNMSSNGIIMQEKSKNDTRITSIAFILF